MNTRDRTNEDCTNTRPALRAANAWPPSLVRVTRPSESARSSGGRDTCETLKGGAENVVPDRAALESAGVRATTTEATQTVVVCPDFAFHQRNEFHWRNISDSDREYLLGPRRWPKPCPWCGGRAVHSKACQELRDSWEVTIPFGKYKGVALSVVPGDYLQWLVGSGITLDESLRDAAMRVLQQKLDTDRKAVDFRSARD
jgi:hypothetical protein